MTSFKLDPAKTALVVIDMTKGVLSLSSGPYPVQQVLAKTVHLAEAFRRTGSFVVLVNVNSVDGKDLLHPITDSQIRLPTERPKDWADLAPELGPHPSDHLVTKRQWGAFFGTDLDLQLRRRGIDTIVLCGIATNFGVETTAREAYSYGYHQVFAEDAMNALSVEEHQHTCTYIFPRMGRIRSTDEVVAAISGEQE
jgi:nicotinamidase-related amidase